MVTHIWIWNFCPFNCIKRTFRRRPWISLILASILLFITLQIINIFVEIHYDNVHHLLWNVWPGGLKVSEVLKAKVPQREDLLVTSETWKLRGFPRLYCACNHSHSVHKEQDDADLDPSSDQVMSTCSPEATKLGPNQKVISYSLFVRNPEEVAYFLDGVTPNLQTMEELYPGWLARIYTDIPLNEHSCALICRHPNLLWCDITHVPGQGNLSAVNVRVWRFLALGDPTVSIMLSRDLDSSITQRERSVVMEWEKSDKIFHVIRDSQWHETEILAGLWGAKNYLLDPDVGNFIQKSLIEGGKKDQTKFLDQGLVKKYIYDPYLNQIMSHDSYFCGEFPEALTLPFPTRRIGEQFVGHDDRKEMDRIFIGRLKPCPVKCRPKYGKDWTLC